MNFSDWRKALRRALDDIPDDEVDAAIDYYKEMFADMAEAGKSEEEILAEFGSAESCAEKIRAERGECSDFNDKKDDTPTPVSTCEQKTKNGEATPKKPKAQEKRRVSVGEIIGLVFFVLILGLPLVAAVIAIVVSFASLAISGIAIALAGGLVTAAAPFAFILEYSVGEITMLIGAGLAMIGVGALIAIGFYYPTKYSAKGAIKLLKLIFRRF